MSTIDSIPFDVSSYLRSPMFSVQEGISLARALCAACPKGVPGMVKRAAEKLKRAADDAQTALSDRQREANQLSEEDSKTLDQEMDNAWGGLRLRLLGYISLPHDQVDKAQRAAALLTQLFGDDGLTFLKETYSAQLAVMQTLLQRIGEDKLDKEIDALCGPEFLVHIRGLMPRYERMVRAMLSRNNSQPENLLAHRNTLSRAVVVYSAAICATVDEDDKETVKQAVVALAPLEGQRAAAASRRNPGVEEPESPASPAAPQPPPGE